ncbi:histone-lysine N-methyltransferase Su(var)3-9 [Hermetia illucens]|uniref:histone-lysine N-methyltransferase Su(var)3-9 n=1 Tax=Hermetia illucens TaxID=343691 RepID=UPI0018CC25D5|nr:histone-lysine N-methyltransferase Su(var)3-9 [Hermetia illucens]
MSGSSKHSSEFNVPLNLVFDLSDYTVDNDSANPPAAKKSKEEYTVEAIRSVEEINAEPHFHIKWKYYPESECTWEPLRNVRDCHLLGNFINDMVEVYSHTIWRILEQVINMIEVGNEPIDVKKADEYDPYAYVLDFILLAMLKNSGSKRKKTEEKIMNRIKEQTLVKPYYYKRKQQKIEMAEWMEAINRIETKANLRVENEVDYESPPKNFTYTMFNIPGAGVVIPNDPPIGCECIDGCNYRSQCCGKMSGSHFAYVSKGKVLRLTKGTPIFECNKRCKCGPDCLNRVVQNGRKNSLTIFKTSNGCGWGVRTEKPIRQGDYICEYVGEIITVEEGDRRGKIYDAEGRTYLFDLDFNDNDCLYTIDAAYYGNISHFINHSCDPNCSVWPVWADCLDPNLPRIALFAVRRIEAGEELTFDYINQNANNRATETNPSLFESLGLEETREKDKEDGDGGKRSSDRMVCRCGASNCRKYLF